MHAFYHPQDLTSPPGSERRAQCWKADRKGRGEQTRPNLPGKEGLGWGHSWGLLCALIVQSAPWASPDQPPTLRGQRGPAPTLLLQGQQVPWGLCGEAGPGAGSASRADSANVTGGSGQDNRGLFTTGRTGGGGGVIKAEHGLPAPREQCPGPCPRGRLSGARILRGSGKTVAGD